MARLLPTALAALAAIAAWLSLGVLAVVDGAARSRVGALPPWWLLVALIAVLCAGAALWRPPLVRVLPLALTALVCLPWLPGRIPAAFLIWYGPPAAAVWVLVVLGMLAPAFARLAKWGVGTDPWRAPWLLACLAALLQGASAIALADRLPDGDEPHYLIIAQSLLTDGDLRIENNHARGDYYGYFDGDMGPHYIARGTDGEIYSIHSPGVSVLLAPAFAVGGYPLSVAALIVLSALGVVLLWRTAWHLSGSSGGAWLAAASFSLTAPGFFPAFTIFPDEAGAVATTVGAWALVTLHRRPEVGRGVLVAAGTALAALPWLHTRFAVVASILGLVIAGRLLAREDRFRAVAAFLCVPLLSATGWFGYFWLIWGTPNPSAPYGTATQTVLANIPRGLAGLLVDQQFGLVPNAPVYAVAFLGMGLLVRRAPRLALELIVVVIPYVLAVASYQMWWGGQSAPARFLVVVLPLIVLPLAALWPLAGPVVRAFALLLLVASVANVVVRVTVQDGTLLYNLRDGFDLLLDWASRSVNLPLAWPSLHRSDLFSALSDTAIWSAAAALCGTLAIWLSRRAAAAWTAASAALALTVMLASTLVWASYPESVTPQSSAVDLLHRWPDSQHVVGWRSRPFGLVPAAQVPSDLDIASSFRGSRDPAVPLPLFSVPRLPAGDYEIAIQSSARPSGQLTVMVGRTSQALETAALSEQTAGLAGLVLRLPVTVHSVTIVGDEAARRSVERLTLRPRRILDWSPEFALRAARLGELRVFFLDDNAYVEPSGFWTRGGSIADMILDRQNLNGAAQAMPVLRLRAGASAGAITVSTATWQQQLVLDAGAAQEVPLPAVDGGVWRLRVDTDMAFRPADHDPGSRDRRNLGAWVEPR